MTWNSATWPLGAPVLAVKLSRTSAAVALTGMVTVLPVAGLNVYVAEPTSVVKPDALCSRPRTANVWVRVPQAVSGLSLTTTELSAGVRAERDGQRAPGSALPSQ